MPIRLVVADHHPVMLVGLTMALASQVEFEVVHFSPNGADALDAVRQHLPHVAVLELNMPQMTGLQVANKITEEALQTKVVLYTSEINASEVLDAVKAGVCGVVTKDMPPELLSRCIHQAYMGEPWIERSLAVKALQRSVKNEQINRTLAAILTPREVELVRMVINGHRNKQIADVLCISEGTVKVHLHNVYEKLKVKGRIGLLKYAEHNLF